MRHEECGDGCGCVVVHDRKHVRVRLKSDRDVRMPEAFLHDTRMDIHLQSERRPRVPQAVQRDRGQMVSDLRPPERLVDTLRLKRRTIGLTEHQLITTTASTRRCRSRVHRPPMLAENLDRRRVKRDRPSA